jgi:hypothetical protein
MTLYQAYAWNGTVYRPISVPKKNKKRAYNEAYTICMSPYPESEVEISVCQHWKEKELLIKEIKYD